MIVLLIGPSGSGKGTQAELLAQKLHLPAISMGGLMRDEIKANSPLGQKVKKYYDRGLWVPAALTFEILKPTLEKCPAGFILDGFPRLLEQLQALENYLQNNQQQIDHLIYLKISDQEAVKRLMKRARGDDTEMVIRQRLKSFKDHTDPILDYVKESGYLMEVDGARSIAAIHQDIIERLNV
jgi:adenylate kinase